MSCSSIQKRRRHIKINARIKTYLYDCIIQHPQVVQSSIEKYCLKVSIDNHSEKDMVTKNILRVFDQELHNKIVSPT